MRPQAGTQGSSVHQAVERRGRGPGGDWPNLKLVLEYDGTGFAGWQRQPGRRTVEDELGRALRLLTGRDHSLQAAGRTDAGAHALGQVVGLRFEGRIAVERLARALNARLPEDVAVLSVERVPDAFHARYSARWRHYRYRYLDRPSRPAIARHHCWHLRHRLDLDAMAEAAASLTGRHDWTTFCAASEPASGRVREMHRAAVGRRGDLVELDLVAEGFLRGLARSIAGALAEVGAGRRPPGWLAAALAARDRAGAARTAPACGLTLVEVGYDRSPGTL